jgi:hypothetical protein
MHRRVLAAVASLLFSSIIAGQQAPVSSTSPAAASSDPAPPDLSAPLPDIQTLLTHVRARSDALESLRKNYICTMTQVGDEFSSDGSKKTHTDQYQIFYVGNTAVLQHISRDGKPLSPEDAKKEQERVDKLVAKLKSHEDKPNKEEIHLTAVLKAASFSNPRREIINSRPTLVFDYKGNPDAKPSNLGEEIMRQLSGTLWIDERDEAILRVTGNLDENFHVGGGLLVNIKKGSWFNYNQSIVNGEIWFPSELTLHVDGHFLLFKGFNSDARQSYTDYRKLKTSVTILPGTQVLDETESPTPDPSPAPPASANPPKPQ